MDLKEISQIVKLMEEHGLSYFQLTRKGDSLELKKGTDIENLKELLGALPSFQMAAPAPSYAHAPAPLAAPASDAAPAAPVKDGTELTSPIVGTYYSKPNPDSPDFVKVGDRVSEGQTLCIIEAMKVMNEIKAEKGGTITAILVDNATPVQYGDALFLIK